MAIALVAEAHAPAWLDGSPGGVVRVGARYNDSNGRITDMLLDAPEGAVGTVKLTVNVEHSLTAVLDGQERRVERPVPLAAALRWEMFADEFGGSYGQITRNGLPVEISFGWVNPDGVLGKVARAVREATR